jgi:hypothetical protein
MSGTSKTVIPQLPTLLSYPKVLTLDEAPELVGKFVYFIRAYKLQGLAVLIARQKEDVFMRIGDWDGKVINPKESETATKFVQKYSQPFIGLMSSAAIPQAIFYLSIDGADMRLVDIRMSLNKFSGPGMVRDLFAKIVDTQEVIKIDNLTPEALLAIKDNSGSYSGDLIIKPSAFKTIDRNKVMYPMYGLVQRQICQVKPH